MYLSLPSNTLINIKLISVKGGLGGWNSYVEAGKDKEDQLDRLKDVPDQYRKSVIIHMRTVVALNEKNKGLQK